MSGKHRGSGWSSDLLDRLFSDQKRSMGIALGIAGISYVLALVFGDGFLKHGTAFSAPFMGFLTFGAMFLTLGFQLINPFCTPGFMDFGELFFGLAIVIFSGFWFLGTGFWQLFGEQATESVNMIFTVAGMWCGLCVVHNRRY